MEFFEDLRGQWILDCWFADTLVFGSAWHCLDAFFVADGSRLNARLRSECDYLRDAFGRESRNFCDRAVVIVSHFRNTNRSPFVFGAGDFPLAVLIGVWLAIVRLAGDIGFIQQFENFDIEIFADFATAAMQHHGIVNFRDQRMHRVDRKSVV